MTETESTRKKGRSPAYPGIDLKLAVDKLKLFHKEERRNSAPIKNALAHMKYSETSGGGQAALSALIKFGLLAEEGSGPNRRVKVTDRGYRIAIDDREDSEERDRHIRDAALEPPIHREMLERYSGEFPSDKTFAYELKTERGFTEVGATEFIRELKNTFAYAGVTKSDSLPVENNSQEQDGDPFLPNATIETKRDTPTDAGRRDDPPPKPERVVIQLPISVQPEGWAAIQVPAPLTIEKWNSIINMMTAMRDVTFPPNKSEVPPTEAPRQGLTEAGRKRFALTEEAVRLLEQVEAGGIPTHMHASLERIGVENGIEVDSRMTPDELVDALKAKVADA